MDAAPPKSLMSVFQSVCPQYMAMGMTYDQFWDGDVCAHKAYREAKKIRLSEENQMTWLQGLYVYEAITALAPALKAFAKGKAKPYVKEPHDMFEEEHKRREERERRKKYERIKAKVTEFAAQHNKKQIDSEKSEVDSNA